MKVNLNWVTPDGDAKIAYIARVSNPDAKPDDSPVKLITYMINHKHVSPFEMACMCLEIETTRDISRQILRHRSFHFQEFSQRYAEVNTKGRVYRECRLQDNKNRQNSLPNTDKSLEIDWAVLQNHTQYVALKHYEEALQMGVAKEVARALLPEGLTPTRMFMQGTVRDWLFYIAARTDPSTQKEHREIAFECARILEVYYPVTVAAAQAAGII